MTIPWSENGEITEIAISNPIWFSSTGKPMRIHSIWYVLVLTANSGFSLPPIGRRNSHMPRKPAPHPRRSIAPDLFQNVPRAARRAHFTVASTTFFTVSPWTTMEKITTP